MAFFFPKISCFSSFLTFISFYLQVTLPKCKSPILIIFEYVVVDVKIRHTYFFLSAENHIYTPLHPFKFMGIDLIVLYIRI